ncbi:hypothetical protein BG004_005977 [Podila humilis]|nr:hypothetical protein BG004_005977 [Podila humilis]
MQQDSLPNNGEDTPTDASTTVDEYYDPQTKTYMPLAGIRPITPQYFAIAHERSTKLSKRQNMLVVLDLNGTLFYRKSRTEIVPRPYLDEFFRVLFKHCTVMIWSSSRRESVHLMFKGNFKQYLSRMAMIWSREDFGLDYIDFHRKVLTLKDLEKIWAIFNNSNNSNNNNNNGEQQNYGQFKQTFDQTNTILIDDSLHKSQLQPYNCIIIPDYTEAIAMGEEADIELLKVWQYLELATVQSNVSAFMKQFPFKDNGAFLQVPAEQMLKQILIAPGRGLVQRIDGMKNENIHRAYYLLKEKERTNRRMDRLISRTMGANTPNSSKVRILHSAEEINMAMSSRLSSSVNVMAASSAGLKDAKNERKTKYLKMLQRHRIDLRQQRREARKKTLVIDGLYQDTAQYFELILAPTLYLVEDPPKSSSKKSSKPRKKIALAESIRTHRVQRRYLRRVRRKQAAATSQTIVSTK